MLHLKSIQIQTVPAGKADSFPFNIPALQSADEIVFTSPVTFLVGENGSGKSTLLEAIALEASMIAVGSENLDRDRTISAASPLSDSLRLIWQLKTRRGFFLRAEDFFGYVKRLAQMRAELQQDLKRVEEEYADRSTFAQNQARLAYQSELHGMNQQYRRALNDFSHGESFLELFQSRFTPGGLYLLDEPEVPLSPSRQLTFISMLKQMVEQDCQFIIATHSPILMAFPGAVILSFDETPLQPVSYDSLEHVTLTRSFLNDPDQYLRYL